MEYVQSNRVIVKNPFKKRMANEDFHRRNGRGQRKKEATSPSSISTSGVESDVILHSPHHGFVLFLDVSPRAAIVI
jgi:hypothetical protein